jgi:hypothetical protein
MDHLKKTSLWRLDEAGFLSLPSKSTFSVNIDLLRRNQRFLLGGLNGAGKISYEPEGTSEVSCYE